MANISGNIITLNEESHIKDCILSLRLICDEIVVVDSGSTDKTKEIAREMGALVVDQPYLGDGIQKNVALSHVKNDWVFSLDADERVTPELAEAINNLDLENTPYEAFSVRRRNYIGDRWIKYCGWYPDNFIRLYNRQKTKFADVKAHARVQTKNYDQLNADLIHWSYKHAGELFVKGDRFSTRGAKILFEKGRRGNGFSPVLHGGLAFIKKYFFKLGFLGGVDGLTVALSAGVNSYLKWAKLLQLQRRQSQGSTKNEDLWSL
ncbi:MAG: glycosyltransferase family 2 protein [Bdellovibrionales bacterium]